MRWRWRAGLSITNQGPGMGDFFGPGALLAEWRAKGDLEGLELEK